MAKLRVFKKFRADETTIDKGRHRKAILQVIVNHPPKYSHIARPTVMYCEQLSTYLGWLDA